MDELNKELSDILRRALTFYRDNAGKTIVGQQVDYRGGDQARADYAKAVDQLDYHGIEIEPA